MSQNRDYSHVTDFGLQRLIVNLSKSIAYNLDHPNIEMYPEAVTTIVEAYIERHGLIKELIRRKEEENADTSEGTPAT